MAHYYGQTAFRLFLILDIIIIAGATIAMFFPGKVAMFGYIGGAICSLVAFFIALRYGSIGAFVILLPIYQGVCAVYAAFMQVTITLEDEFLSEKGIKSRTAIPYDKIDYLTTGIFSTVDFRSAPGRIRCVFVRNADSLFRAVYDKRKEKLALNKTNIDFTSASSIIDELPDL